MATNIQQVLNPSYHRSFTHVTPRATALTLIDQRHCFLLLYLFHFCGYAESALDFILCPAACMISLVQRPLGSTQVHLCFLYIYSRSQPSEYWLWGWLCGMLLSIWLCATRYTTAMANLLPLPRDVPRSIKFDPS